MTAFTHRSQSWLLKPAFDQLSEEHCIAWQWLEDADSRHRPPHDFGSVQNEAMLLKLFLEQAFGDGHPTGYALRLIERDMGGIQSFQAQFVTLASDRRIEWIVWGLSFADFRFHLFPVSRELNTMPFCVSPMLSACVRQNIVDKSSLDRETFARRQFTSIDWSVVEKRIACLEKPLDLFGEVQDCVENKAECSAVAS
jgi:hypothetical protein